MVWRHARPWHLIKTTTARWKTYSRRDRGGRRRDRRHPPATPPTETLVASPERRRPLHPLRPAFILQQIQIAEANSNARQGTACSPLLPNSRVAFGLRTVDGSLNNLMQGQSGFGASDNNFPLLLDQVFRNDQDGDVLDRMAQRAGAAVQHQLRQHHQRRRCRSAYHLQPDRRPDHYQSGRGGRPCRCRMASSRRVLHYLNVDGIFAPVDDQAVFEIPNTTPDAGLSAPASTPGSRSSASSSITGSTSSTRAATARSTCGCRRCRAVRHLRQ